MVTWATRDRAEAAEARVAALEARLRDAAVILRLHNKTATGLTIRCLDRCLACEFLREKQ